MDAEYAIRLHQALDQDQIVPYFQPLVDLRTGVLSGFEVLARWADPVRGLVSPNEFIPVAEKTGLIGRLTKQLIDRACVEAACWPDHLTLSVNVSPRQLHDYSFPEHLLFAASGSGFQLSRLIVEITESALVENFDLARDTARALKDLGLKLAIDDFGTGYSSLSHLQALPFDRLKIDASFVRSMTSHRDSRKIVAGIVGLAHSLDLTTVAEGLEESPQAEMLFCLGCDLGQGWLFGRPVPAGTVSEMLANRATPSFEIMPAEEIAEAMAYHLEALPHQRLAQLQAIYDGAPVGLCFLDRQLRYVSLNRRLAEMNGASVAAHLGRTPIEIIPDQAKQIHAPLMRALSGEPVSDVEIRRTNASNQEQVLLVSYQPVRDEAEEVMGISIACVDITARTRAEEALRESMEHYRYAVELNPQVPWTADPNGLILDASPRWQQLTGLTHDETINHGWIQALHPDDAPRTIAAWSAAVRSGNPVDVEYRIRCGDGSFRWMRARASPRRGAHGEIIRWYGAVEDVHDLKMIEQQLRDSEAQLRSGITTLARERDILWKSSRELLLIVTCDGTILRANPAWKSALHWEVSDLIRKNWLNLIHPEDQNRLAVELTRGTNGPFTIDLAGRCVHKNGTYSPISWHLHGEREFIYAFGQVVLD